MHTESMSTMTRYLRAIAPVYLLVALATVVGALLIVSVIAHPLIVLGFALGVGAGILADHYRRRFASVARGVHASYAGLIEEAHHHW